MKIIMPILIAIIGLAASVSAAWVVANAVVRKTATKTVYAPVGTVAASFLAPEQFAGSIGEKVGTGATKRTWILADGRDVTGTDYAKAADNNVVPDLRGMFLRGLNAGRSDGKEDPGDLYTIPKYDRQPGHFQDQAVGIHDHEFAWYPEKQGSSRLPATWYGGATESQTDIFNPIRATPGPETRPRNVAVYYYIRINSSVN